MKKILIENAYILTMDKEEIRDGYVLINDNFIEEIGVGNYKKEKKDFKIINGKGYCVMPGMINSHTHAAMTLLRGYGEGLPLMKWLNEKIWPMEAKFNEKHIKLGTSLACIEMIRTGTTVFNDMYFHQQEVLNVCKEIGMRSVLGMTIIGEDWEEQIKRSIDTMEIIDNDKSGLVKTMFAPHSPYTLSFDALKTIAQEAQSRNKDIHIHISETEDEGNIIKEKYNKTTCELLKEVGLFENNVVGAHCVYLTEGDMEILKESNASVVYNPQSNMKLASGVAKINTMLNKGINICIGTDGTSSNNNLNMFEEMETGALLQKLYSKDATIMGGEVLLKMATINGAKALGVNNIGKVKEGYKADLIMINLNRPNLIPLYDIYSNLVFSANGSEIEYVIIDGKIVLEKGEFVKVDEEKILFECKQLSEELIK